MRDILKFMPQCYYCGNNPIPHSLAKTNEIFSVFMAPFDRFAYKIGLRKLFDPAFHYVLPHVINGFEKIGIVRFNDDTTKSRTTRSKVIWQEARARGIPMRQLLVFGKPTDFHKAIINGETVFFESLPIPRYFN